MEYSSHFNVRLPSRSQALSFVNRVVGHRPACSSTDVVIPKDGRAKVRNLSQAHLDQLVRELAPKVRANTGYALDLSKFSVDLTNRRGMAGYGRDFKFPLTLLFKRGGLHGFLAQRRFRMAVSGCYDPHTKSLSVARKAFQYRSWNALRLTVYHELVHAAQQQTFPRFGDHFLDLVGQSRKAPKKRFVAPDKAAVTLPYTERMLGIRSLAEGDARFHEMLYQLSLNFPPKAYGPFYKNWTRQLLDKLHPGPHSIGGSSDKPYDLGLNYFSAVARKRIDVRTVNYLYNKPSAAEYYLSSEERIKELSQRFPGERGPLGKDD